MVKPIVRVPAKPTTKPKAYDPDKDADDYLVSLGLGKPVQAPSKKPIQGPVADPKTLEILNQIDKPVLGPVADPATLARQNVGLNFQGPVSPEVLQAFRKLRAGERIAIAGGADKGRVQSIAAGKGDPDRGLIGPAKKVGGFLKFLGGKIVPDILDVSDIPLPGTDKNLGEGVKAVVTSKPVVSTAKTTLEKLSPSLNALGFGRRLVTSTLKEVADGLRGVIPGADDTELEEYRTVYPTKKDGTQDLTKPTRVRTGQKGKTGFSFSDWAGQTFGGTFGIGDAGQDVTGGFIAKDLGPAWFQQVFGFAAEVGLDPLTYVTGAGGLARTAGQRAVLQGGKLSERVAKNQLDNAQAILAKEIAKEALVEATRLGDDAAVKALKQQILVQEKKAADAARQLSGDAVRREVGQKNNQTLAGSVQGIADDARDFIVRAEQVVGNTSLKELDDIIKAGAPNPLIDNIVNAGFKPEQFVLDLGNARGAVEALTDEVISEIAAKGLAGIAPKLVDFAKVKAPFKAADGFVEKVKSIPEVVKSIPKTEFPLITPAQEALGVRGGLRIFNPLEPLGLGPTRVNILGTERLTNAFGRGVANTRVGLSVGEFGQKFLSSITPTTERGVLGSDDIIRLKAGLRTQTLSPADAADAVRLLKLDTIKRAAFQKFVKSTKGKLVQSGIKDISNKELNDLIPFLQNAPDSWPRQLSKVEQKNYDIVKKLLDDFANETIEVGDTVGFVPGIIENYFPFIIKPQALKWMKTHPKTVEKLADKLKVDRTWFLGNYRERTLKDGDNWFGHTLTPNDLYVSRLNELARKPPAGSGIKGLTFDFFEADLKEALVKYADRHADHMALLETFGQAPERFPSLFGRGTTTEVLDDAGAPIMYKAKDGTMKPVTEFVNQVQALPTLGVKDANELLTELGMGANARLSFESLLAATPAELNAVIEKAKKLALTIDRPKVIKQSFIDDFDELQRAIDDLDAVASARYGALSGDEKTKLIETLQNGNNLEASLLSEELKGLVGKFPRRPNQSQWSEFVNIIDEGLVGLNPETLPDIGARTQVAEMINNAKRLGDEQFANGVVDFIRAYNTFSKQWLVLRPGFYLRNAYSNAFQLAVAGADPINTINGVRIMSFANEGFTQGKSVREIATEIVEKKAGKFGLPKATSFEERTALIEALEDTFNFSGAAGFGQYGEIAGEVAKTKPGVLGGEARGLVIPQNIGVGKYKVRVPLGGKTVVLTKPASKAAGGVAAAGRRIGQNTEEIFRFGLMWDGVKKGLTAEESIARVNRYLFDYQEFSKLDRVARLAFPFWTFMSRNAPLAWQLKILNPKVFNAYSAFRNNFEDKRTEAEGGVIVPSYLRDKGQFVLKSPIDINVPDVIPFVPDRFTANVFNPGLPFQGGGEELLQNLVQAPKKVLASISPLFRAPVEAFLLGKERGEKLFSGGYIVPSGDITNPFPSKIKFLIRELYSPASPLRSIVAFVPNERRGELLNDLLGLTPDDDQENIQELQALLGWGGLPLGNIRTSQQVRELEGRASKIGTILEDKRAEKKQAREEKIKERKKSSSPTSVYDPDADADEYLKSLGLVP